MVKRVFFLLNVAVAMEILDLISRVELAPFVTMLSRQLELPEIIIASVTDE
jgi:hypothetical protein